MSADEAVNRIERLILSGGTHQICPVNTDVWLNALNDPHLHRIMAGCSMVIADGMPLVWVSGLLDRPLAERITGVDMVPRLAKLSAEKGYKIFLLGGRDGVADRAAELLRSRYPGAQIVGTYSPSEASLTRMNHNEILERIHAVRPDILLVAFGNPKQEKWIWMNRKRLGVPVAMGVGGSFDILIGDTKRAPEWIQRSGLEWAMRLIQEPVRLAPRYTRDFIGLMKHAPVAVAAAWLQRPYRGENQVTMASLPQALHVYVHGRLGADLGPEIMKITTGAVLSGQMMVVHLSNVKQMTAAGLGILLSVRRQLLEAGLSLSLAGLNMKQRFVLYAWCLKPLFDEWHPTIARGRAMSKERSTVAAIKLPHGADVLPAQSQIPG